MRVRRTDTKVTRCTGRKVSSRLSLRRSPPQVSWEGRRVGREKRERQNSFLRVALFLPPRENVLPAEEDRGTFARGKGTKSPFLRPSSRRKRGEDFELEVVGRVTLSLWRHLVSQPLPPSPPTSFLGVTWPSGDSPSFERRHWATHSFLPRGKFFSRLSLPFVFRQPLGGKEKGEGRATFKPLIIPRASCWLSKV